MAGTNEQGELQQTSNPFSQLIRTAVGLSPLGYGAYRAYGNIKSNAALNPGTVIGTGAGNLPAVGSVIGQALGAASKDNRTTDLKRLEKITNEIMDSDGITRMFQSMSEQNALVQSLVEAIDDPTTGFEKDMLLGYREKLVNLARDQSDPEELKKTVQTLVQALSTKAPEPARLRWAKNLRENRKLGPVLTPPGSALRGNPTFNPVDSTSLAGDAETRYNRLVKGLGAGAENRISVVSRKWGGVDQFYARVYSGSAADGRSSFQELLPLSISKGNEPFAPVFTNENMTTGYVPPRQFLDGKEAAQLLAGGGPVNAYQLSKSKAGISVEDYFISQFVQRTKPDKNQGRGMGKYAARSYREWKSQFLSVMPRYQYSVDNKGVNQHLGQVGSAAGNYMNVVNMDGMTKGEQTNLMLRLGTTEGFEANAPGYQFLVNGLNNQAIGRIGMREGSALTSLTGVEATRGYFPVESRIEQVFHGGGNMFVGKRHRRMGRGGVLTAGATAIANGSAITHLNDNIEWASNLTGATNKAVLMPTTGKWHDALEGKGMAYTTGAERARMFTTKPILDPGAKGYMASSLFMDEILHETTTAADGTITRRQRAEGEEFTLTRAQIEKHGAFLGFGDQGTQHMRMDPRMKDMQVSYSITESHGKPHINIMSSVERDMDVFKVFSLLHKGGVESKDSRSFARDLQELGFSRRDLSALRLQNKDMLIADPSLLKKGAGFFDLQMTSGYGLVAGDKDYRKNLEALAKTQQYSVLDTGYAPGADRTLSRKAGAVIKGLSDKVTSGRVSTKEAGHVLAAIYTRGDEDGWIKGPNRSQAIKRSALDTAFEQAFGKDKAAQIRAVAEQGVALGATSAIQGSGPGDWALGRGSVEPRFITNLQHRLQTMGMSVDEAGEVISGVYANKLGFASNFKTATGLMHLAEGITGQGGITEGIAQLRSGLTTFNLKDLPALSEKGGFEKIVAANPDGFYFDPTSGADTVATRAISANAIDTFKSAGPIYIPGRDVAEAMKDTFIKQARDISGDASDTLVSGPYNSMMKNLFEGLGSAASRTLSVGDESREILSEFKGKALGLMSDSLMGLARGKIRGMSSAFARAYDLDHGTNFSDVKNWETAKALFKHTKGQAAFQDTYAFFSQLNDWMGTAPTKQLRRDAARKAEMFFSSAQEVLRTGNLGKARGIVNIGTRHPEVGIGNVTPLQVFRHLEEISGGAKGMDDVIFQRMSTLSSGKWSRIKNFDQANALSARDRLGFYTDLIDELPKFAPEGGGSLMIPHLTGQVAIAGQSKPMSVDFGISGAAGGDYDGDQWMAMMMSREHGKRLMGTMDTSDAWLKADALYKIQGQAFTDEAKAGLQRHTLGQNIGYGSDERVMQSLMKEQAAKASTGQLDTQLNRTRMALLDRVAGDNRSGITQALALLKVVEEHSTIKGKKAPVYMPFAESITNAVKLSFDKGDHSEFRRVMRDEIFKGSALRDGDMMIDSVQARGLLGVAEGIKGEKISLNAALDQATAAMDIARTTHIADSPSAYWVTKHLGDSATPDEVAHHMALVQSGNTLESAQLLGFNRATDAATTGKSMAAGAEVMLNRVQSSLSNLDRKTMGIAAAAIAGSLGVMGLIGHQGYAPQPMVMAGEIVSPDVKSAIARGEAFTPSGRGGYPTAQPQMTPTTYLKAPNAYQVGGSIGGLSGVGRASDYLGQLPGGSRGSIRINDSRRPISGSYMDRMSGEY